MHSSLMKSSLLASSLLLTANAWPLVIPAFNHQQQKRAPASYSVVAVDGGSSTADSAPTATVTNLITRTQFLTTTQIATSILSGADDHTTVYLTNTITIPTTIIENPALATPTPPASFAAASSPSSAYTFVTVTITNPTQQPPPTSTPYDNGMWHTTYYYNVPAASSTPVTPAPTSTPSLPPSPPPPSSPVAASSSPIPTFDNGQWKPAAGWNSTWGGRR